jgi:hypothetical protein
VRQADDRFRQTLPGQVASIFASIFNIEEHLDILFLEDGEQRELAQVCNPFLVVECGKHRATARHASACPFFSGFAAGRPPAA